MKDIRFIGIIVIFAVAFFTQKLSTAQKKYSAYDRELLAAYLAIKVLLSVCHTSSLGKFSKMVHEMDMPSPLKKCCVDTFNKLYPCDALQICKRTLHNFENWKIERQFRITGLTTFFDFFVFYHCYDI